MYLIQYLQTWFGKWNTCKTFRLFNRNITSPRHDTCWRKLFYAILALFPLIKILNKDEQLSLLITEYFFSLWLQEEGVFFLNFIFFKLINKTCDWHWICCTESLLPRETQTHRLPGRRSGPTSAFCLRIHLSTWTRLILVVTLI